MRCAICNEETIGRDPVKWGPEFAHRTCVVAFSAGQEDEREECAKVCEDISGNEPSGAGGRFGALDCAEAIRMRSNAAHEPPATKTNKGE